MKVDPVILTGRYVRLEPLSLAHAAQLVTVAQDEDIWRYMLYGTIYNEDQMRDWIQKLLDYQAQGTDMPFAVIHIKSGRAAGATRFMDIRPQHRGLEIGGTWYGREFQRTVVNTECKYLLLRHAFEVLGCIRVQLKTDLRNERSQRAIERIGAIKEGVLRNHMITPEGVFRHSVYYSIIDTEWSDVKLRLETLLA